MLHGCCRLSCVSRTSDKVLPTGPQNVTFVGNRLVVDVISCDEVVLE